MTLQPCYLKNQQKNIIQLCFIVSSDKDFVQLVTDKIILYRPMEKEYYTPETVKEKFGVYFLKILFYIKHYLGDNSDKIPRC